MEASSLAFLPLPTTLLSRMLPVVLGAVSYAVTSLTSLLLPVVGWLQRTGETLLTVFVLLSMVQALVALYQYRYDVRGQLVFPDGLTYGREDYYEGSGTDHSDVDADADRNGEQMDAEQSSNTGDEPSPDDVDGKGSSSWAAHLVKRLNRSLVLLLPWLTRNVRNLLTKNTHLFHIGFIVFILDSLLPFMPDGENEKQAEYDGKSGLSNGSSESVGLDPGISLLRKMNNPKDDGTLHDQDPIRILVIGDSLAIGIGCVEQFDATKDNSVPMALIENTAGPRRRKGSQRQGPVFPQVLARTLSYHCQRPVQWRSAGVDGGDIDDIRTFCLDVVRQEGSDTDIVVVLFGINDLKKIIVANPLRKVFQGKDEEEAGTVRFRRGMEALLSDIRVHAPNAFVVFPALPMQAFHKNSIINIFPVGLMVDAVMGLWEGQKKIVARDKGNAMYVELKAKEVADWYERNAPPNGADGYDTSFVGNYGGISDDVLLSADGVHPNKRMYGEWAELVGHKVWSQIAPYMYREDQIVTARRSTEERVYGSEL